MKKIEILKASVGIIVSVGVGAIVGNGIKSTTPDSVGTIKKVCIGIGAMVLSSMIGDQATKYTETKIDNAVKTIETVVNESKTEV